jgi:hypothetical protein
MQKLSALLLPLLIVVPSAFARDVSPTSAKGIAPAHRVAFAYHSAFLMNLHHFLYDLSVHKDKLSSIAWHNTPSTNELQTLREAVAFYRVNFAALGLRDDPVMLGIKRALSVDDARRDATGLPLPQGLAAVLNAAAPVYARNLWPLHDLRNRRWIAQAGALDTVFGAEIQTEIERHLGAAFPTTPIRGDVVFDTGTRQGAYTDEQIVMPSNRADYQGLASLEMLYHEASHTTVTEPLEAAIEARMKALGRKDDSDLWHVTQFYTVGKVTREVLARHGNAYQPYADKRGLYSGYWAPLMPAVEKVWLPHMEGKLSMQEAAVKMVDLLPAE